jgi:hypothetical protein
LDARNVQSLIEVEVTINRMSYTRDDDNLQAMKYFSSPKPLLLGAIAA